MCFMNKWQGEQVGAQCFPTIPVSVSSVVASDRFICSRGSDLALAALVPLLTSLKRSCQ